MQAASVDTDGAATSGVLSTSGVAWSSAAGADVTFSTADGRDITIAQTFASDGTGVVPSGGLDGGGTSLVADTTGTGDQTYGTVTLTRAGNLSIASGGGTLANSGFAAVDDDRSFNLTVEGVALFNNDQNGVTAADVDVAISQQFGRFDSKWRNRVRHCSWWRFIGFPPKQMGPIWI